MRRTLLTLFFLFWWGESLSQNGRPCNAPHLLVNQIKAEHFSPPAIDEKFHTSVIEELVEILDPDGLYFLESDIKEIKALPLHLNDPAKNNSCEFIDKTSQRYQVRLTEAIRIVTLKTAKPFDYTLKDSLFFSANQISRHEETVKGWEKYWEIWLKASTLSRMAQTAKTMTLKDWMAVEKTAREKVRDKTVARLNRLLHGSISPKEFVANALLKSIALSFDPHTNYFTNEEFKDFDRSISSLTYSFGFELAENSLNELVVNRLAPGGPAWNTHLINKGDVLVSVTWPNGEVSNALDFDDDELEDKINEEARLMGTFTFRKADGSSIEVKLQKEKSESIDDNVQSLLLKGEKSIGYISLPRFYSDFDGESQSCADDVAKEIIKLKKENISALILDLRFNGGGSVQEAVDLAGVFIDVGPMLLLKTKDGQVYSWKDQNRGLAYDGPLLILVNSLSASAAEITAATLQDYNRAIVVGSTSYGKATSQVDFPVIQNRDTIGYVKITNSKAYRITGKTHQHKGVKPDIDLPDFYSILDISERSTRHSLPPDSVIKKVYYTPWEKIKMDTLRKRSVQRVKNTPWFTLLNTYKEWYAANQSLEINAFILHYQKMKEFVEQLNDAKRNHKKPSYRVMQNTFDGVLMDLDENRNQLNKELVKEIEESIYIEEAYQILVNHLSLRKK
ncbi:MAG: carboxy terminal-processing peptidase [Cyclobacteriaceae bacterium]